MFQRVEEAKEQWEEIDGRLRDLLVVYATLVIISCFFFYSASRNSASLTSFVSSLSVLALLGLTAYLFIKSEFKLQRRALGISFGFGVVMFGILTLVTVVTGSVPPSPEESLYGLLIAIPLVATFFYIAIGGTITAIMSLLGISWETKSEDEIIEEVLEEDEEDD